MVKPFSYLTNNGNLPYPIIMEILIIYIGILYNGGKECYHKYPTESLLPSIIFNYQGILE